MLFRQSFLSLQRRTLAKVLQLLSHYFPLGYMPARNSDAS
jgi:hypothetical protein